MHGTLPTLNKFLSAEALHITEPQREALIAVLGMLERGELAYVRDPFEKKGGGHTFNMSAWNMPDLDVDAHLHECGSVCCIGGTAERLFDVNFGLGPEADGTSESNPRLWELFYADSICIDSFFDMKRITPTQAARALRSYLATGHANWKEAVS